MKKTFLKLLSLQLFAALSCNLYSQVYPIQVTTQLKGPYTPYLSDYTAPGSQKLTLQFRVNDPTITEYRAKLRITIEGVGITLTTKQSFIPSQPIVLEGGGLPQMFYGDELAEYFNPNNLTFGGLSEGEYRKSSKLPEGVYRFTVEVLDYNRNTLVSNKGMAMAWIILNDPPMLNLPRNESKINLVDPTNIVFTWTGRHKSSVNAALSTEYIFRLIEIWPLNRNPYDAFLSQPPLYEVTSETEQIIYGPAEPALIPGRKYAWQVQAIDIDKRDLFKNQGRSEVFVFQYGDPLGAPENLRLQSSNPSTLTVRWDQPVAGAYTTNYRLRYRLRNNRLSEEWYQSQSEDLWKAIPQLRPETEYEVQVRAEQQFQNSEYSQTKVFKTLPQGANEFVCKDDTPPPPPPSTTAPLFKLSINDTIRAGGYDVLVRSITGGTGTYTGEGFAIIPYLNGAKVRVTFENIRVNEQFMLTSGEIKTFWNAESKFLLNNPAPPKGGAPVQVGTVPVTIAATTTLIEVKGAAIATITKDEDGNVIVHTTAGEEKKLQKGESYSVVDDAGNGYVVDKEGNIAKTTAAEAKAAHERGNRTYALKVKFDKGGGNLGFDEKRYDQLASHYQQLESGQYVAWKAVTKSQQEPVDVLVEGAGVDPKKLRFEVNAQQVTPEQSDTKLTLKLQGQAQGMVEELLAMNGEGSESKEILGKLNLVSYDEILKDVIIVPVNNPKLPGVFTGAFATTNLNTIYQQSVTKWTASMAPNITVTLGEKFDDGSSGLLSNYTGDMKKVINAFGRLQDNKYYIFLVEKPQSGTTALGYMPRSKQAGFVFVDNHSNDPEKLIRTIAHELGHGSFNLKHTFSEYPSLSKGATDNLMDYNYGTSLNKYQWDFVHDPQSVIALFEGDSEGELTSLPCVGLFDDCDEVLEILEIIRGKRISNKNLVILYPKDKNTEKNALYTKVNGEEFQEIKIIYEGSDKGTVVHPMEYKDYVHEEATGSKKAEGFIYENDGVKMKIIVIDEANLLASKKAKLKAYLFGTDITPQSNSPFEILLTEGNNAVVAESTVLINAIPEMPDLRVKINAPGNTGTFKVKLVIEYLRPCVANGVGRSPNQSENFPISNWTEVKNGEEWDINYGTDTETNRPKIRGGRAYIIVESPSKEIDTLNFYIKGANPTVAQVNTFVNQAPYNQLWFFKRLIFHESGTPNDLNANARQFNVFNQNHENLGEDWGAFSRCPNFGPPCGWGLMQLDNPQPPSQTLWDWKANIIFAYDLLEDKQNTVLNNLTNAWNIIRSLANPESVVTIDERLDGTITYVHQRSTHFTHDIDTHFGNLSVAPERSFIEACWIKTYNGLRTENGNRHYYYLLPGNDREGVPPQWTVSDYAIWTEANGTIHYNHYVRDIGQQNVPQ